MKMINYLSLVSENNIVFLFLSEFWSQNEGENSIINALQLIKIVKGS